MEDTIILYPSPGMGHLVPMVELGKLILYHNPSFSIIILITTAPFDTGSTSSYIKRVTVATPSVHFHHLPTISPPSTTSLDNIAALAFELPRLYNSNLHHALQTMISQKSRPTASIIDFFCNSSLEVFTSLDIPTYYFFTSSAIPPIPTPDLPGPILDTEGIAYKSFFGTAINMVKSTGILTNTCHAFERRAVKAISDGLCTPNLPTPLVYCIGPIVANSDEDHEHECLRWLDSQPSRSVVFLCFGSMGLFKAEQLTEMAIGLEKSGHRVLVVEEMKVALALEQSESGFVSANELEKHVRELMDSMSGEGVRERVRAMRDCAKAARGDGGSSRVALAEYIKGECSSRIEFRSGSSGLTAFTGADWNGDHIDRRIVYVDCNNASHTFFFQQVHRLAIKLTKTVVMEDAVILYPSPAIGHLISMVELGKLILTHSPNLSITILVTPPPYNAGSTAPYINHVSATTSSINFHHLPAVSLPPNNSPHHETLVFELLRLNNPNVNQAITSIAKTSTDRAVIMDFFCYPGLSVAADFNLPAYSLNAFV
ncbi:hypothetical protein RHSIM_Rhsim06G0095200 [Rhododendron simsii]|uniref:Uncharacterized protein n=1 Tax=Rhododendron simsii TaxID=118357 RepID=A0A834GTR3_RHOSS|nr:hypothetical protein RHSIM_Rhsim06G0095200 [Rhododendron simsii]